ncbi:MAG: TIGR04282 family arsenosugar biosynthesis glycosyltransferase [Bacteroidia bacterium]
MTNHNDNLLMVFIKNPIEGKVKTRLARTVGNAIALEVYLKLLAYTLDVTHILNCDKAVFYSDFIEDEDVWKKEGFQQHIQNGNDLGERMQNAFAKAFSRKYKKVLIIGSDCPELSTAILNKAFEELEANDFVIGPTYDGGYYLLGMKTFHPAVFVDKEWSTENVFLDTIIDINKAELSYAVLPSLSDLDDEKDLKIFAKKLRT